MRVISQYRQVQYNGELITGHLDPERDELVLECLTHKRNVAFEVRLSPEDLTELSVLIQRIEMRR